MSYKITGIIIFCFVTSHASWAQKPSSGASSKEPVEYTKKTVLDFEAASVDGQFLNPEGSAVKGDKNLEFDSLLEPKANFNREMGRDARSVR